MTKRDSKPHKEHGRLAYLAFQSHPKVHSAMAESPQKLFALGAVFSAFPIPFVCARFWARHKKRIPILLDDWSIVIALVRN